MAKKGDNVRIAISAEAKKFDGHLPKVAKNPRETALIMDCLRTNTFMKDLQKDQLQKVKIINVKCSSYYFITCR